MASPQCQFHRRAVVATGSRAVMFFGHAVREAHHRRLLTQKLIVGNEMMIDNLECARPLPDDVFERGVADSNRKEVAIFTLEIDEDVSVTIIAEWPRQQLCMHSRVSLVARGVR